MGARRRIRRDRCFRGGFIRGGGGQQLLARQPILSPFTCTDPRPLAARCSTTTRAPSGRSSDEWRIHLDVNARRGVTASARDDWSLRRTSRGSARAPEPGRPKPLVTARLEVTAWAGCERRLDDGRARDAAGAGAALAERGGAGASATSIGVLGLASGRRTRVATGPRRRRRLGLRAELRSRSALFRFGAPRAQRQGRPTGIDGARALQVWAPTGAGAGPAASAARPGLVVAAQIAPGRAGFVAAAGRASVDGRLFGGARPRFFGFDVDRHLRRRRRHLVVVVF